MAGNKWDERFIRLAEHVAQWSRDPSTKVGCVIVRPDRTVVSVGFNGFPRGVGDMEERYEDRSVKYPMIVHAELNAILTAHEPLDLYTLYTPLFPCNDCAKSIIQSGITRVVSRPIPPEFQERWKDSLFVSQTMFVEAGVVFDYL